MSGPNVAAQQRETGSEFMPKFDENGLLSAVVTHAESGEVLMVAFMNEDALAATRAEDVAHFWSRSRQSLWKKGKPLFAGSEYAGLSQMALYYVGGILKHARALCAICNPTTNSYKRLVPGYEAPVNLAYSARNRSAAVRIPTFSDSPKAKRIEYRPQRTDLDHPIT